MVHSAPKQLNVYKHVSCMPRFSVGPDLVAFPILMHEPPSIRVVGITTEQCNLMVFFSFIFYPDLWRV